MKLTAKMCVCMYMTLL